MFLILVLVLVSCKSLAGNPQSPSHGTTVSSTRAISSDIASSWKTYTNADVGFSIQYPADWLEQDLPDENEGQRHHIALQGPEGGVELVWGTGLGGACPEGYQPMAVWSLAIQRVDDTAFSGFVYTNDTTANSREVVLQVISTLSFP
jgi:hypothetical protein